ncbi:MAG: amidase family protein, partial [Polyangiaceae bacterium]
MTLSLADAKAFGRWDAVETRERIQKKEVSREDVVEAAIARAEAAQSLGAIVTTTFDRAREKVRDQKSGAFSGVPSFIKDLAQLRDVATQWGSRGSAGFVSTRTDR